MCSMKNKNSFNKKLYIRFLNKGNLDEPGIQRASQTDRQTQLTWTAPGCG